MLILPHLRSDTSSETKCWRVHKFVECVIDLAFSTESAKIDFLTYSYKDKQSPIYKAAQSKSSFKCPEITAHHCAQLMSCLKMSKETIKGLNRWYKQNFKSTLIKRMGSKLQSITEETKKDVASVTVGRWEEKDEHGESTGHFYPYWHADDVVKSAEQLVKTLVVSDSLCFDSSQDWSEIRLSLERSVHNVFMLCQCCQTKLPISSNTHWQRSGVTR